MVTIHAKNNNLLFTITCDNNDSFELISLSKETIANEIACFFLGYPGGFRINIKEDDKEMRFEIHFLKNKGAEKLWLPQNSKSQISRQMLLEKMKNVINEILALYPSREQPADECGILSSARGVKRGRRVYFPENNSQAAKKRKIDDSVFDENSDNRQRLSFDYNQNRNSFFKIEGAVDERFFRPLGGRVDVLQA